MSQYNWTEDGFGFQLFNDHNMEKVFRFIADNTEYKDIVNCEDPGEAYEYLDVCCAQVIADIINKRYGYTLFRGYSSCSDTDSPEYLGITPTYTWCLSNKDRHLTRAQAVNLLLEYGNMLDVSYEPDYFEAEYCG